MSRGALTPESAWQHLLEAGGASRVVEIAMPSRPAGWVVVGRSRGDYDRRVLASAVPVLQSASLATLTIDLPARRRAATGWVRSAVETLRLDMAGGQPVAYLGAGTAAGAGWAASLDVELDGVMAWNGKPGAAWSTLRRVRVPSLLVVDDSGDVAWRMLIAKAMSWQLASADVEPIAGPLDSRVLARWYWDRILSPTPVPTPIKPRRARRHVAALGAMAALAVPALGASSVQSAGAAAPLPDFGDGSRLSAQEIHGDSWSAVAHRFGPDRRDAGRLTAGEIFGDHVAAASPFAIGSGQLIDGSGVEYFINSDITFSTSSSASGAMSEARYTHAVSATTLNGGNVQSRLYDGYDGYNTVCVAHDHAVASCETGNANFTIYNKNGPATLEANGRQFDFAPQTISGLTLSRKVFVPSNDSFARWLNIVTNPGSTAQTVTLDIANNLGSDANTVIVTDSSGNTAPSTSDTWVTTFQNYIGTTSSDPRLGHVLAGPGAPVGLAGIHFTNGDDNPFWGYTFTLDPGQTKIIMNFAVVQPSKAAAASKSAELASLSNPNELNFMTPTEQSEVVNFAIPSTADQLLTQLAQAVTGVGPGTSLVDKVNAVTSALGAAQTKDACNGLNAFINEVKALVKTHRIAAAQGAQFVTAAEQIEAAIPCG